MLRKEPRGDVDPEIAILAAGLQQQDGGLAIRGQAIATARSQPSLRPQTCGGAG